MNIRYIHTHTHTYYKYWVSIKKTLFFLQGDGYGKRSAELKEAVRRMLREKTEDPLEKLELVDAVQRLGVSYHFRAEIRSTLELMMINDNGGLIISDWCSKGDLYAAALHFRLLRQHQYKVPQGM